jgi:hypothetical protein
MQMSGRFWLTNLYLAVFFGSSILLTACGGGGGSGSAPAPTTAAPITAAPTIAVSQSPVAVSAVVTDAAPTANVSLTFGNAPSGVFLSVNDSTTTGISSIGTPTYDSTTGSFTIAFKSPGDLKPAVYSDTVTLLLCSDPQCKVVLASNPLQVTYTVKAATGSSAPSVALDSTTQTYSALYVQNVPVRMSLDPNAFSFANFTGTPYVQVSVPTTSVIVAPQFAMSDATHGGIIFTFAPPNTLAQNSYSTPVTVTVCIDPNCVNPVAGGSFTLTVNYVVTNKITGDGANGYTMAAFPLAASLIASNPQLNSILAVVAPTAPAPANSVQKIDPATGTSSPTPLTLADSGNSAIALSDDGQYLYVNGANSIQQIQTSTLTAGLTIPIANGTNSPIAVQPGHSQTIAAGHTTLQIFDGTVARPNVLSNGYLYQSLAWTSNPAVLAVELAGNTIDTECSLPVDPNGVTATVNCQSVLFAPPGGRTAPFTFAGGFGYGSGGAVLRESDWTYVASLSPAGETLGGVIPDLQMGKAFALMETTGVVPGVCSVQSFALASNAAVANIQLPAGVCVKQLVRWGTNGLALSSGTDLLVISGAFVGP